MPKKLFVGGLSWGTTDASLRAAFEAFGPVRDATIVLDRETNRSRGFGFVTFEDDADAKSAIAGLDGQPLDGRRIRISEAQERPRRGPGGPGGPGGGPPRGDRPARDGDDRPPRSDRPPGERGFGGPPRDDRGPPRPDGGPPRGDRGPRPDGFRADRPPRSDAPGGLPRSFPPLAPPPPGPGGLSDFDRGRGGDDRKRGKKKKGRERGGREDGPPDFALERERGGKPKRSRGGGDDYDW